MTWGLAGRLEGTRPHLPHGVDVGSFALLTQRLHDAARTRPAEAKAEIRRLRRV